MKLEPMLNLEATKGATPMAAQHPATRAWAKLTRHQVVPEDIEILQECVRKPESIYRMTDKPSIYRLTGVGPGETNVIAKRRETAAISIEYTIYKDILPYLSVSTVGCYGLVSDADPRFCWLFLEDAGEEEYWFDLEEHRVLAGHWLGVMNVSAQQLPATARLPDRGPAFYLALLRKSRRTIREILKSSTFGGDDSVVLQTLISHCDALENMWEQIERICNLMPRTLVHGDFADQNARIRVGPAGDRLLIMDWEGAGWGPPAVDLAQFVGGSISPSLHAYYSAVRSSWPWIEPADLELQAEFGRMFRLLNCLDWANWGYRSEVSVVEWYVAEMKWCESVLADWIRAAEERDR